MTLKEKLLHHVESDNLTTEELAYRLYGGADVFTKNKVLSLISSLRKSGIDMFPMEGIWTIPDSAVEFKKFIGHKKKHHFGGLVRMLDASFEGASRYKAIEQDKNALLKEIELTVKETNERISHNKNKARQLTAPKASRQGASISLS